MQHTLQLDVVACLAEDGFSLDELVIQTRRLFETEGMAGMIGLILRLTDELLCRRLVCGEMPAGGWRCCERSRYAYKDFLERTFRTSAGTVKIVWHRLRCRSCGRSFVPLRTFLGLNAYRRKTSELEKMVVEVVSEQSYRRGADHLERIGEIPVPKSTAHRWVMESEGDELSGSRESLDQLMADGTGFKRRTASAAEPTNRGELRVVLGMTPKGTTVPLGVWSGRSWEEIGAELDGRPEEQRPRAKVLVSDGEPGLAEGLSRLVNGHQRCQWHAARDLNFILWRDEAPKDERRRLQDELAMVLGVEIPKEDVEPVTASDRQELAGHVSEAEGHLERMIRRMNAKGYAQAAGYLERMKDHLFTYVKRWLATGVVSPRTSSWMERVMREIARRLKRMAFGWSERGATKMCRIVLKRFTDRAGWEAWWQERLRLDGRVQLIFQGVKVR